MKKLIYWLKKTFNGNRKKHRCFCPVCEVFKQCREEGGMV